MLSLTLAFSLGFHSDAIPRDQQLLPGFKYLVSSPDPSKPETLSKIFENPVRGKYFDIHSRDIVLPHYGYTFFTDASPNKNSGLSMSAELLASLEGKTIALTGFENDHYEKLENGTWVPIPMYRVYNHHSRFDVGSCRSYASSVEGRGSSHQLPKGYGCFVKVQDGKLDGKGIRVQAMVIHGDSPYGRRNLPLPVEAPHVPLSDPQSYWNAVNECPCIHGKGYNHSTFEKAPGGIGCCPHGFTNLDLNQTDVINASKSITFQHRYRVYYEIVEDDVPLKSVFYTMKEVVSTDWPVYAAPKGTAPQDAVLWQNKSFSFEDSPTGSPLEVAYLTIHVHAPAALAFTLYETTGGKHEPICEVPIVYGKTDELWDERGYVHTIPCIWGYEDGLATPPKIYANSTFVASFSYNNTYDHYGVMTQVIYLAH